MEIFSEINYRKNQILDIAESFMPQVSGKLQSGESGMLLLVKGDLIMPISGSSQLMMKTIFSEC